MSDANSTTFCSLVLFARFPLPLEQPVDFGFWVRARQLTARDIL